MKLTYELIKKIISILSLSTSLGAFLVTTLCTNTKSPTFIEYTDLSKFFLNLYILILLILMLFHSIYPKMVCSIFTNRLGIITSSKGKITILVFIMIMYFSTESLPQKLFGMISFVSTLAFFLSELFLNCETLKQKPLTNDKFRINSKISSSPITVTNIETGTNINIIGK